MTKNAWLLLAVLLVAAGYLGYVVHNKKVPCVTPISYGISQFDPAFNISQAELEADVQQAAALWNDQLGTQVLVERSNPELPVYFEYGSSQQTLNTVSSLSVDIEAAKQAMTDEANRYQTLTTQADKDASLKKYYALKAQVDADIAKNNATVSAGNVEDGRYVADNAGTRIYIYGFKTKADLLITLAHEFGHALGLEHVSGGDSIMSPSSDSTNLVLSPEDITELKRVCGTN
jgi:hypothetical protein